MRLRTGCILSTPPAPRNGRKLMLRTSNLLALSCLICALPQTAAALSVTQPTAATIVQAGDDYATQVLGDAWDMNNALDVDSQDSYAVAGQGFSAGVFSG